MPIKPYDYTVRVRNHALLENAQQAKDYDENRDEVHKLAKIWVRLDHPRCLIFTREKGGKRLVATFHQYRFKNEGFDNLVIQTFEDRGLRLYEVRLAVKLVPTQPTA